MSKFEAVQKIIDKKNINAVAACRELKLPNASGYYAWKYGRAKKHGNIITIEEKPVTTEKFIVQNIKSQLRSLAEMVSELERRL